MNDSLQPGVTKREVFAWAMYDFANSGYTTVVLTAVYAAYFVAGIAQNAPWGTFAWTVATSVSHLVVMLTMPLIGALADRHANKKRWLMWTTAGCVLSTLLLSVPQPGAVVWAGLLIVASNLFFSYGETLNSAFLPELAKPEAVGRVSGWGWSLGYLGGLITLGLSLAYVIWAQDKGMAASQYVAHTLWITAAIYGLASLVTFTWLKERAKPNPQAASQSGVKANIAQLKASLTMAKRYPDFYTLLQCGLFYQAGVAVAISLAAIYAQQAMGFETQETMIMILALQIAASVGAFACGYLQDKMGHKRVLAITLVGWILTCVIAAVSANKGQFWVAATLAGLSMGSSQSVGRALVGLFSPTAQRAEFFSLWTFATRLAAIMGPLCYSSIAWMTQGNHRVAIVGTTVFFVAGLWFLSRMDVARGQRQAMLG